METSLPARPATGYPADGSIDGPQRMAPDINHADYDMQDTQSFFGFDPALSAHANAHAQTAL
jgi:hypothetical protein